MTDSATLLESAAVSAPESETTPSSLPLHRRVYRRLAAVRWRSLFTVIISSISVFVLYASISLIGTFFPTEAADKEAIPFETGVVIAMAPLSATIFAPIFGYFIPKLGRNFSMTTGLCVVGGAYIALGTTLYLPNGWPFVLVCALLRFVEGIGIALFNTAATFLFVQAYPDSVGLMVGIRETSAGLGYVCGPVIGGYLYLAGGYKVPFFSVGAVCLLLAIPTFTILTKFKIITSESRRVLHLRIVLKLLMNFIGLLLLLANILLTAGLGFMITTNSVFQRQEFSLNPHEIGLMFLTVTVPYITVAPITGKVADMTSPRITIIGGLLLYGISFQLFGPTSLLPIQPKLWISIIGGIINGIGFGTTAASVFPDAYGVALKSMQDYTDSDSLKSIIVGLMNSASYFGQFIGPIIGGGLTSILDYRASTSIYGEIILTEMLILLLISVVDLCFKRNETQSSRQEETELTSKSLSD